MLKQCLICGSECNVEPTHNRKIDAYCSDSCRGQFYRDKIRRNNIQKFIETDNLDFIKVMQVRDIIRLFPTAKIRIELQ